LVPFLSSIVTVSFAHFIKNLPGAKRSVRSFALEPWRRELSLCHNSPIYERRAYLTSFIVPFLFGMDSDNRTGRVPRVVNFGYDVLQSS
jgi:hypothetical protein